MGPTVKRKSAHRTPPAARAATARAAKAWPQRARRSVSSTIPRKMAQIRAALYLVPIASPAERPAISSQGQWGRASQRHQPQTAANKKKVRGRSVVTKRLWAIRLGSVTASSSASQPARSPKIWRAAKKRPATSSVPSSVIAPRARTSSDWASLPLSHKNRSENRNRSPACQAGCSTGSTSVVSPHSGSAASQPASGGWLVASRKSPVRR